MQGLFSTSFRPIRQMAQANVAVAPTTTPPAAPAPATPAPTFVPVGVPVAATPTTVVTTQPAIPTAVWIAGGLLLIGAVAFFASNASAPRRRR